MYLKKVFVIVILLVANVSGQCHDLINELQPKIEKENSSLIINWSNIRNAIKRMSKPCHFQNVSIELWRVVSDKKQIQDFEQPSYFNYFERCNKLDPDHFQYHSSLPYDPNESIVGFRHVVEDEYILRLCGCRRGRHQRSHQRVCDCHNPFKAQCSRVLDVKPTPSSQPVWKNTSFVMDWCKNSPSKNVPKSEFNLNALLLNCTHLNIKGSMASCTPIQTYDKVKMTFHKVKNNSKNKNFNCTLGKDFLSKDSVSKKVRIFDTNETSIGEFDIIVGLSPASKYCVTVEFVDHPYCIGEITIGKNFETPKVCSAHIEKPVSTSACVKIPPDRYDVNLSYDRLFLIIVCSLSAIIFILCISTFRTLLCKFNKRKYLDENGIDRSGGGISKNNKTNLNCELANCIDNHPISRKNRVFLLHFLSNDSDHEDVRCKLLREWIQSVVEVVDDIEDENNDEEINQDPEGWVQSKLSGNDVRVVVVASKLTLSYLRMMSTTTTTDSTSPYATSSSSSCTTSSTEVSPNSPSTSVDSLNHPGCTSSEEDESAQEQHRRQSLLLFESAETAEVASEESAVTRGVCLNDSRHELRMFALKHIQSRFIQNYRQLVVVSFDKSCLEGKNVAKKLTPNKGPLILPNHLPDLQDWVSHDGLCHSADHDRPCCLYTKAIEETPLITAVIDDAKVDYAAAPPAAKANKSSTTSIINVEVDHSILAEQRLREALKNRRAI